MIWFFWIQWLSLLPICKDLLVILPISDFLTKIVEFWVPLPRGTSLQFESMDFLVLLSWGRKSLNSKVDIQNDDSLWKRRTNLDKRWADGRGISEGKFLLRTLISVSPVLRLCICMKLSASFRVQSFRPTGPSGIESLRTEIL